MSNIEIKEGIVLQDGEQIATIDGNIVKSESAINRQVKGQINKMAGEKCDFQLNSGADDDDETEEAESDPEPEKDPNAGDLTPKYIEWHRRNKTKEEHEARYEVGEARLVRAGLGRE